MKSLFTCPVCGEPLEKTDKTYRCAKNHCFDIAKQGYVNLLLSSNMNSKLPGDNKLMVRARRDFLSKGYYKNMCDALGDVLCSYFTGETLLDAGCGEGYYTAPAVERVNASGRAVRSAGIDISKTACGYAAKKCPQTEISAASIFRIPMADGSADNIITLFAPFCRDEFFRVIPKGGRLIMVIPSPMHLWELKAAVYDKPYPNETADYEIEGFAFTDKVCVDGKIHLPCNEDIANLFTMTPYYYKTGEEGHRRVAALDTLDTRTGFEILVYTRK